MHGELEAPNLEGRFVRVCPDHRRVLDGLECPVGHHVDKWATVDRQKNVVQYDNVHAEIGGRGGTTAVVEVRKPASLLTAGKTNGDKTMADEAKGKATKTIISARFVDKDGAVLFIQLVRKTSRREDVDPWRVSWRSVVDGEKSEAGYVMTSKVEGEARAAHAKAITEATKSGWVAKSAGRSVVIRAIPAGGSLKARGKARK